MTIEDIEKHDPVFLSPEDEQKVIKSYIKRRLENERKIKRLEKLLIGTNIVLIIITLCLVGKFFNIPSILF